MFFNATTSYWLSSGHPGEIISDNVVFRVEKGAEVNLSGPSLLMLRDAPCSLQFDVRVDSDEAQSGPVYELIIPDQLFVSLDVPQGSPNGNGNSGQGLLYGFGLSFGTILVVILLVLLRSFCRKKKLRGPPIKKPSGPQPNAAIDQEAPNPLPEIDYVVDDDRDDGQTQPQQTIVIQVPDPYGMHLEHCGQDPDRPDHEEDVPESPYDAPIGLY
jgi:hypothetical protein